MQIWNFLIMIFIVSSKSSTSHSCRLRILSSGLSILIMSVVITILRQILPVQLGLLSLKHASLSCKTLVWTGIQGEYGKILFNLFVTDPEPLEEVVGRISKRWICCVKHTSVLSAFLCPPLMY